MNKLFIILISFLVIATPSVSVAGVGGSNFNPANAPITGGSIDGTPIGSTTPSTGKFTGVNATTQFQINGKTSTSATAPTIASGFGTSPSIVTPNGTSTFQVNVGTGGVATSGIITMPAATTGWNCSVNDASAPQAGAVTYSASTSTTSITLTNYTLATGVSLAWAASEVLSLICVGF